MLTYDQLIEAARTRAFVLWTRSGIVEQLKLPRRWHRQKRLVRATRWHVVGSWLEPRGPTTSIFLPYEEHRAAKRYECVVLTNLIPVPTEAGIKLHVLPLEFGAYPAEVVEAARKARFPEPRRRHHLERFEVEEAPIFGRLGEMKTPAMVEQARAEGLEEVTVGNSDRLQPVVPLVVRSVAVVDYEAAERMLIQGLRVPKELLEGKK